MDSQYLENIKMGMRVQILTSQKKIVQGLVAEIAPGKKFCEEGIMVILKGGEVGRVKKIILSDMEQNAKTALEIKKLIEDGENVQREFKSEAFWSLNYTGEQLKESKSPELREFGHRASKIIIAKSIASFLNSKGGDLLIGVKENKESGKFEIGGIDEDMKKLRQPGADSYRRTIVDEIVRSFLPPKIYNHLDSYVSFDFATLDGKTVCRLRIKKSDSKVFLKINDKEMFMIRVDSENRTLEGERLVDYCIKNWGNRV